MNKHLLEVIPSNLIQDDEDYRIIQAIGNQEDKVYHQTNISFVSNLEKQSAEIINHLLWENHIGPKEGLALATTKERKINLINNAIELHRIKGTPAAVELVFNAVNLPFELEEWFLYGGEPYHFRAVTEQSLANVDIENVISMILEFKNVRSHLENITVHRKMNLGLNIGGATSNYLQTHISPPKFEMPDLQSNIYYGALVAKYDKTDIGLTPFTMADISSSRTYGGVISSYKITKILAEGVI